MVFNTSFSFAQQLDRTDPLAPVRRSFLIPKINKKPLIYFSGNSLGLQPKTVKSFINQELTDWATLGVDGHLQAKRPWTYYHRFSKKMLSKLCGASPPEVIAMSQLTVNLHLLLSSFYRPSANRYKIVIEKDAFSSDYYAIIAHLKNQGIDPKKGLIELTPRAKEYTLRTEDIEHVLEKEGRSVALILLGAVNYLTGQFFDIERITQSAHQIGAYVGLDLAHAIGQVPLHLHKHKVDFAVWCSYKYLNAGPGAVGGAFVHTQHHKKNLPRLSGWWGSWETDRFLMKKQFRPMVGVDGWQVSNFSVLSGAPLLASLQIFEKIPFSQVRNKGKTISSYLIYLLLAIPNHSQFFDIITPLHSTRRGCQVSLAMKRKGKIIFTSLLQHGIRVDWRHPNVIRIAPVPLYNSYQEVYRFVAIFKSLLK